MPINFNALDIIFFGVNQNVYERLIEPYNPLSLKDIVSTAKNSSGNNILQQLVLDSAIPNRCSENYMISVLYSISDSAVKEADEDGYLPLHVAVKQMNCLMVEKLLTLLGNRIDINAKTYGYGKTALHYAAEIRGGQDMISLLISKGADVNARDHAGRTPIFGAVGDIENVKVLVENGADVNARNNSEVSPLFTIDENHVDVAIFLIRKGANVHSGFGQSGFEFLNGQDYQRHPSHNYLIDMLLN